MIKSWLLPLLMLGTATPGPQRVVESRPAADPPPRSDAVLQSTMTTMHNAARATVGLAPLAWDARLASEALAHAREMARTGKFAHAPQPRGDPDQGENLWTGSRGDYRYEEMMNFWLDEHRLKRPVPKTVDFLTVPHYAQIIRSRTTRFGCGLAANARDELLVCRYVPAGNVAGETPLP